MTVPLGCAVLQPVLSCTYVGAGGRGGLGLGGGGLGLGGCGGGGGLGGGRGGDGGGGLGARYSRPDTAEMRFVYGTGLSGAQLSSAGRPTVMPVVKE
jgi:hypothetical protein